MANDREAFDLGKVKSWNNGRRLSYTTKNKVWTVDVMIRRLPGGVFTSGETWRRESNGAYRRKHAWDYGPNDDTFVWTTVRNPPDYIIGICKEMGAILHKKFRFRGNLAIEGDESENNYWRVFGGRSEEFWIGVVEGIRRYAWWKNGEQFVGTCGTSLKKALADVVAVAGLLET
jgi:hypothetical protein